MFTTKYTFYVWTYVYSLNYLCSKYFLWLLISFHSNRAEMENEEWYSKLKLFISLLNYLPTLIWSKERFFKDVLRGEGRGRKFLGKFYCWGWKQRFSETNENWICRSQFSCILEKLFSNSYKHKRRDPSLQQVIVPPPTPPLHLKCPLPSTENCRPLWLYFCQFFAWILTSIGSI